jgi:hypothetical protein
MNEIVPNRSSRLRTLALLGGGFVTGIAVTVAFIWGSLYYSVAQYAESPASTPDKPEDRLVEAAGRMSKATKQYDRWLALDDVAMWNIDAGSLDRAKDFADELLTAADQYKNDWNYGNAFHKGHIVLGRLALRQKDVPSAITHLLEAGKTPGSPQLNSFGPNMMLAKELLEVGERKAVLDYFELCGQFWKNDFGALSKWKDMVRKEKIPNFGANLVY